MAVQRWTLYDPATSETYTFPRNPSEVTMPGIKTGVTFSNTSAPEGEGHTLVFAGQEAPGEFDCKGVFLTKAERDAIMAWVRKKNQVLLTDDLDEEYWVWFDSLTMPRKNTVNHELRITYSLHGYIIDVP